MANTIRFFRDKLTINRDLILSLGAGIGDTLVMCGRQVTLAALESAPSFRPAQKMLLELTKEENGK